MNIFEKCRDWVFKTIDFLGNYIYCRARRPRRAANPYRRKIRFTACPGVTPYTDIFRFRRYLLCAAVLLLLLGGNASAANYNVHNNKYSSPSSDITAEETTDYYKEIYDYANSNELIDNMPDTAKNYIDIDFDMTGDVLQPGDLSDKFNFGVIFNTITSLLGKLIPAVVKNFFPVIALIILSALASAIKNSFESESFSEILDFILIICLSGIVFYSVRECFYLAKTFLDEIQLYMQTMIPVMASLSTVSGNISAAAVNSAGIYVILSIVQNISGSVIFPVLQICYSLSLAKSLTNTVNLEGVTSYIRSIMNWIFIFIMTVLVTVLLFQNILASAADTVVARTVKFTLTSFIPVIGGVIGEASRTIMGSIGAVKSVTGVFGIFAITATLFPPLITVALHKFMLSLSGAIALVLGMDRQAGFLKEMKSLLDITLAIMVSVAIVFIFSITIFIQTGAAI